jgi:hypothetical protein
MFTVSASLLSASGEGPGGTDRLPGSLVILPLPPLDFHLFRELQHLIPASNSFLRRLHCYRSAISIIALPSGSFAFQLSFTAAMADYQYGGSEEENAELRKLETELVRVVRAHFTGISR